MTKLEILKFLREQQKIQNDWLDSIPKDIYMAFVDNSYVDSLHLVNERLMQEVFGDAYEAAMWFLYDFKPSTDGHVQIKEVDGTEWSFADDSQCFIYFKKVCGE